MPLRIVTSRSATGTSRGGAQHVDVDQGERSTDRPVDHAQAAAGQAGVDPEHAHEQPFVRTSVRRTR